MAGWCFHDENKPTTRFDVATIYKSQSLTNMYSVQYHQPKPTNTGVPSQRHLQSSEQGWMLQPPAFRNNSVPPVVMIPRTEVPGHSQWGIVKCCLAELTSRAAATLFEELGIGEGFCATFSSSSRVSLSGHSKPASTQGYHQLKCRRCLTISVSAGIDSESLIMNHLF